MSMTPINRFNAKGSNLWPSQKEMASPSSRMLDKAKDRFNAPRHIRQIIPERTPLGGPLPSRPLPTPTPQCPYGMPR